MYWQHLEERWKIIKNPERSEKNFGEKLLIVMNCVWEQRKKAKSAHILRISLKLASLFDYRPAAVARGFSHPEAWGGWWENINDDYEDSLLLQLCWWLRKLYNQNTTTQFSSSSADSLTRPRKKGNIGGGAEISKQKNLNKWSLIYVFLRSRLLN